MFFPLFLSTKGTKKHEREKGVFFRVFRVFRVFRGPSLLYSCAFVVLIRVIRSSRFVCIRGFSMRFAALPYLQGHRIGFLRIDPVLFDGLRDPGRGELALIGQGLEGGQRDVVTVDLEELAELAAHVATAEAVGAQDPVAPGHEGANLVRAPAQRLVMPWISHRF